MRTGADVQPAVLDVDGSSIDVVADAGAVADVDESGQVEVAVPR